MNRRRDISASDRLLVEAYLARREAQAPEPKPAPKRRGRPPNPSKEPIDARKARQAEQQLAAVRDRRRFKLAPIPDGRPNRLAPEEATGTVFPSRVFEPSDAETVLKDGASNAKIGGDVLVGRLRGAHIVTLTLEERATCPRSCLLWSACYGNSMQFSRRWRHGPELERRIEAEVAALCAKHDNVLVRLHVLGDFYSASYAWLWARLVDEHPGLHVFGFTAHPPNSEIGGFIAALRQSRGLRFAIRHSGRTGVWGAFTIDFPTERKTLGDAVVCPEQVSAMNAAGDGRHCGSCGVCWSTDRPIVFVEH